jgi:hypothetical protein
MGHCGEFGDLLWATAATLVMRYGPLGRIWLHAVGNSAKPISMAQNNINFCKKLAKFIKGKIRLNGNIHKQFFHRPTPSLYLKKIPVMCPKKIGSPQWPQAHNNFLILITQRI